jgi:hypothetical protein
MNVIVGVPPAEAVKVVVTGATGGKGEEPMFNREFQLDSDEKSICYSATINYVGMNGQATKGFQK